MNVLALSSTYLYIYRLVQSQFAKTVIHEGLFFNVYGIWYLINCKLHECVNVLALSSTYLYIYRVVQSQFAKTVIHEGLFFNAYGIWYLMNFKLHECVGSQLNLLVHI
jgi:hypothetical protein